MLIRHWWPGILGPVRRQVTLKLIKRGMDSRNVLARFESERQALALMEHPHIARVLDAGTTADGRPFFVMDLVKGIPITEYCDAHRLDVPARLALFGQVCSAVQHAHQQGLQRDLAVQLGIQRHEVPAGSRNGPVSFSHKRW